MCSNTAHVKLVDFSQRWDEVSIEEETEDGKKISSKIRVPMQVVFVLDILVSSRSCMYDNVIGMGVIYLTADFRLHGMSRTCCTVCVEKSTEWEAMQSRGELFTVFLDKVFREIFALV